MPRRFRGFLKKKGSGSNLGLGERYSNDSSTKYEYDIDNTNSSKGDSGKKWSFHSSSKLRKYEPKGHKSSRSLGALEVNGRMNKLLESDDFQVSEDGEDERLEDLKFINRKYSTVTATPIGRNLASAPLGGDLDEGDEEDDDDDDESADGLQELDRACVRLDGIEVYAIVSALTCATAINCFDNYDPTPLSVILRERAVFTVLAELVYYCSGAVGMMTGLHATLIFSLVTMYGRTAVGIDRDDAFNSFFANTGPQRFNGFRSFKISLYCFMTQLSFLIGQKFFFEPLRPLVLMLTTYLAYSNIYVDSEQVLSAAGVIYSDPEPPKEDSDDEEDRRASLMKMKNRRGSVRNKSFSISTRNFGVDTSSQRRGSFIFGGPS